MSSVASTAVNKCTPLHRYYVSPVCFFALLIPMMTLEAPRLADPASWARVGPALLLASAALAFCLNISVFLLVGRTSALVGWRRFACVCVWGGGLLASAARAFCLKVTGSRLGCAFSCAVQPP